jgi:ATP-dependent RNA helicase HelY
LVEHLGRRLAVLEELSYVDEWRLSARGLQLSRVYHEADLLVAEILASGVLDDAEPPILAGVLSTLVFERRRARRSFGGATATRRGGRRGATAGVPKGGGTGAGAGGGAGGGRRATHRGDGGDRIGDRRRRELVERLSVVDHLADQIRAVEEVHLVPRTRQPEHGLAGAICSWARGASLRTVLEVAAHDVGEVAPGDFVRTVKQLVDLAGQVASVAADPAVAASAHAAAGLLRRDVVAAGGLAELVTG